MSSLQCQVLKFGAAYRWRVYGFVGTREVLEHGREARRQDATRKASRVRRQLEAESK
jgi:hypothetical protein